MSADTLNATCCEGQSAEAVGLGEARRGVWVGLGRLGFALEMTPLPGGVSDSWSCSRFQEFLLNIS